MKTRVRAWHEALAAVRAHFAANGLAEVTTPVALPAVALEPYIEPVMVAGAAKRSGRFLATSPELPMKQLLARGSGPLYQIAPVFRRGEAGAHHREEFRLVEWYRLGAVLGAVRGDVEAVVTAVFAAVANAGIGTAEPPARWETHGFLDVLEATTGLRLRGDEDAEPLREAVVATAPRLWVEPPAMDAGDDAVRTLSAWTSLFTTWSDADLGPWLTARPAVHLVDFPAPLAALARLRTDAVAERFESHVAGLELANGYGELTDAGTQRARFEAVAGLRQATGAPPLPMPAAFLADLDDPGLPPCCGAALGLDRLVMLAAGAHDLAAIDPLA